MNSKIVSFFIYQIQYTQTKTGHNKAPQPATPQKPGQVLEFERITRESNQNVYECVAQNAHGVSQPTDVRLNVLYAPVLVNTSHSESVLVGSRASLACNFDGNPEPEVKWLYTDPLSRLPQALVLENSQTTTSTSNTINLKSMQNLDISNVSYRNEGDYHCEARNNINGVFYGVRSSNIILDVFGEPQFLAKGASSTRAHLGTRAELTLAFCADPTPNKVYWQFGSIRLDVR